MTQDNEDIQDTGSASQDNEQDSDSEATAPAKEEKPNIVFVGREKVSVAGYQGEGDNRKLKVGKMVRNLEPITSIVNGMDKIDLPSVEEQAGPFYHPQASTIIALFPDLYKEFREK